MRRFLKPYADRTLGRKVAVVRGVSLLLLGAFTVLMVFVVRRGEIVAGSRSTWSSPSVSRTVTWADSPIYFVFQLSLLLLMGLAFIGAVHLALVRTVERLHGRWPFARRRYPH